MRDKAMIEMTGHLPSN